MADTLAPGFLLNGRYRIVDHVGKGGMGTVYKAADIHLGSRLVAVKEMTEQGLSPQEIVEATQAFEQEAHLLAGLHHPCLPSIHDHFSSGGRWYLVMEFIEGETLAENLRQNGTPGLPAADVLGIADQLCDVLDYLHQRTPPIIFRDLKPSNIMVVDSGNLYLIDFGIARLFKPGQTHDTVLAGTAGYAAPEQYGKSQTTVQSDIYSFGATLHELLTGEDPGVKPFIFSAIQSWNPQTPPRLEALVMQMVQMDESKRPSSVAWIRLQLHQIANQMSTTQSAIPAQQFPPPVQNAPTHSVPPSTTFAAYPNTPVVKRRGPSSIGILAIIGVAIAVLCAVALIFSAVASALNQSTRTAAATQTPIPTSTPPPTVISQQSVATFQSSETYTYNVIIGHSITTALTNSDVNVTLQSLTVNDSASGTLLVVGFYDYDTQEGTNFAFHTLAHVYFTDNEGNTYQAISADPSQVELQPQQGGTVQVTFPSLPTSVSWLDLYFNTDLGALVTQCVHLLPTGETSSC